jgi:hypothetical protein
MVKLMSLELRELQFPSGNLPFSEEEKDKIRKRELNSRRWSNEKNTPLSWNKQCKRKQKKWMEYEHGRRCWFCLFFDSVKLVR